MFCMTPKIGRKLVENEVPPNVFRSFEEGSRDVLEASRVSQGVQEHSWSDFRMNEFSRFFANFREFWSRCTTSFVKIITIFHERTSKDAVALLLEVEGDT